MKPQILIVDDDDAIRLTVEMVLSANGQWETTVAATGEEGLDKFQSQGFDVVIVDKNLPGMSGTELSRKIRDLDKSVNLIMMTGYATLETAMEMMLLGVDNYLEKPFDHISMVEDAVKAALEKRSQQGISAGSQTIPFEHVLVVAPNKEERAWFEDALGDRRKVSVFDSLGNIPSLINDGNLHADLLIADTNLQDPDVRTVINEVKKCAPGVCVVLASSGASLEEVKEFIELGVAAIIEKPLVSATLNETLSALAQLLA
jgi:DNA-binding NtrC family response regulator